MGRTPRVDIEGYWYHVISCGQRKEPLFHEESDYRRYLQEIGAALTKGGGNIGAYCLMVNHTHLLIKRGLRPLAKVIQIAHSHYSKYYNLKYEKCGHVFQGRYKAKIVLNDKYLERLIIYIHQNALRAGVVKASEQYRWSSDKFYRGEESNDGLILMRVPGFEDEGGTEKYKELIDTEPAAIPEFKDYIGREGEEKSINRRKPGRDGRFFYNRRGPGALDKRLRELCEREGVELDELKNQSRSRHLAKLRSKIMITLYRENYPVVEIAREFNRTPSSVFSAVERQ